jgi:hypothetical protein
MDQNAVLHRNREGTYTTEASHPAEDTFAHHTSVSDHPLPKRRGRAALFWGMGGTILSGVGFIALALFEQYNGMLSELRGDLKHFNETASEFVKRESFQRFRDQFKERMKEFEAANLSKVQMEQEMRASEKAREELAHELQRMRERVAYIEGRQTAAASVDPMIPAKE